MNDTPIFDQLHMEYALGPSIDCDACVLEYRGWGGPGCCEICDTLHADHTCNDDMDDK